MESATTIIKQQVRWGPLWATLIILLVAVVFLYRYIAKPLLDSGNVSAYPEAIIYIYRTPEKKELEDHYFGSKFEPLAGCYLGAFIDLDGNLPETYEDTTGKVRRKPEQFEKLVGKEHAMYFFYMAYGRPFPTDWVQYLHDRDKFIHIALEPNDGLEKVMEDQYLYELADAMRESNVNIFLRFASEMNGPWVAYHGDPELYKQKWRMLYRVFRDRAPNVAMVWCPYTTPIRFIPYYYPGDEYVDWVGVNFYSVTYNDNDLNKPAEDQHPIDMLNYIYENYSHTKPIMICEFAATHFAACEGYSRPDWASNKIRTLYAALPRLYPRVKCINYFNSNNIGMLAHRANNDYSVTNNPMVLKAYSEAVSEPYFLPHRLPDNQSQKLFEMPMPLKDQNLLSGTVRLTCWAREPKSDVFARFRVGNILLHEASGPEKWTFEFDTARLSNGKHLITLDVFSENQRIVASQTVGVIIQN